jgi:hypothetical protein
MCRHALRHKYVGRSLLVLSRPHAPKMAKVEAQGSSEVDYSTCGMAPCI